MIEINFLENMAQSSNDKTTQSSKSEVPLEQVRNLGEERAYDDLINKYVQKVEKGNDNVQKELRERYEREDELQYQVYKNRLLLCIPYNFVVMYGTFKYAKNASKHIKSIQAGGRANKFAQMNMFLRLMGSLFGILFLYMGGNLLIMGVNPVRVFRERREREEEAIMAGMLMHQNLTTQPGNINAETVALVTNGQGDLKDLMMVSSFKQMGLNE